METPRPAVLSLDEREARCTGAREKLGDVLGRPTVTLAISGETVATDGLKTTASVRERLAEKASCSPGCVVMLKDGEALSAALRPIRFSLFVLGSAFWS